MREAPVGLAFWNDERRLAEVAAEQGSITHQDLRCCAGAAAVAAATSFALQPGDVDVTGLSQRIASLVEPIEGEVANAIRRLPEFVALPPSDAVRLIAPLGKDPSLPERWRGIVVWSLYAFLRTPDDYWETVCTAIAVGGDVDTTAAIAGAISGARVGLAGLPEPFARRVNDAGTWGYDELVSLATDLHRAVVGG